MIKDATSLKAQIRNRAKEIKINPQVLLQNYMHERFLERLSLSEYKDKFVLKGGALISALVGLNERATMDLDASLRGMALTEESITEALRAICAFPIDDGVALTVEPVRPIRKDDIYGGYRAKITAAYDRILVPISLDITAGDKVTPKPIKYSFREMFNEEKKIELWAYNIETVMAEKIETILRRNILSTRPRDFYDVYILSTTQAFNTEILKKAVSATAEHRGTTEQIVDIPRLLEIISVSEELKQMWEKYRREYSYAANITYEQTVQALRDVCALLFKE